MPTPGFETPTELGDIANAIEEVRDELTETNTLLRDLIGELRQLRQIAEPWVASSQEEARDR